MRSFLRALGFALLIMLAIFAAFLVWLFTAPAYASERCGRVSYYGSESGSRTANGERFDPSGLTIALRSHDFGVRYRVTYGGRSVVVRHNDYGPAVRSRIADLSYGAAAQLRMVSKGVAVVCISRVKE